MWAGKLHLSALGFEYYSLLISIDVCLIYVLYFPGNIWVYLKHCFTQIITCIFIYISSLKSETYIKSTHIIILEIVKYEEHTESHISKSQNKLQLNWMIQLLIARRFFVKKNPTRRLVVGHLLEYEILTQTMGECWRIDFHIENFIEYITNYIKWFHF